MNYEIEYAYTSHKGLRRSSHEDNFWCDGAFLPVDNEGMEDVLEGRADWEKAPAFAVFDGMGGESCGEIASGLAAEVLDRRMKGNRDAFWKNPTEDLTNLCAELNQAVLDYQTEQHIFSMGSTAVLLMVHRTCVYAVNLGDSRLYRFSAKGLRQVSEDHVLSAGNGKGPLLQYLGLEERDALLLPYIEAFRPQGGEQILLCSDGLTDLVTPKEIEEILRQTQAVREAVQRLRDLALERGGRDNITIILLRIPKIPYWKLRLKNLAGKWRDKS